MSAMPRLKKWAIIEPPVKGVKNQKPVFAAYPNPKVVHLYGHVYDHPTYPDGSVIVTSPIRSVDEEENIAATRSSDYALEEKHPAYEEFLEPLLLP